MKTKAMESCYAASAAAVAVADTRGRFLEANGAFQELTGYSTVQLATKTVHDIARARDLARSAECFRAAMTPQGEASEIRKKWFRADGKPVHVNIRAVPVVDGFGEVECVVGLVQDLTESRESTARLKRQVRAERSARRRLNALLAQAGHELRNSSATVLGLAELIDPAALPESERRDFAILRQSAHHLGRLVNDLMDAVSLHAAMRVPRRDLLHTNAFLEQLYREAQASLVRARVSFHLELGPNLPPAFVTDETLLRQILANLIGNAFRYTSVGSVRLSVTANRSTLQFSVSDTGPGIDPKLVRLAFQPFVRLGHRSHTGRGLGLGLSIAGQLARSLGGHIAVSTALGNGSTFTLAIPNEVPSHPEGVGSVPAAARRLRILLVDDNPVVLSVQRRLLQALSQDVVGCASPEECLRMLDGQDLVLLDLHLAESHGVALATQLRSARLRPRAIVALTGDPSLTDLPEAAGVFDEIVLKPLTVEKCMALVSRWRPVEPGAQKDRDQ